MILRITDGGHHPAPGEHRERESAVDLIRLAAPALRDLVAVRIHVPNGNLESLIENGRKKGSKRKGASRGYARLIESRCRLLSSKRMGVHALVISIAIEPKTKADQERLGQGLQKLMAEDPTFRVQTDQQTGQTIIAVWASCTSRSSVDRLKREFSVDAIVGKPQVAYKEKLTRAADGNGRYVRRTGAAASTVKRGFICIRASPAPATCSRTKSSAAPSPRNSSSRSRMGSGGRSRTVSWRLSS